MSEKESVIALDGPSSSGKSTIAKAVAEKLGLLYLNTGAMYRALGVVMKNRGYSLDDSEQSLVQELLSLKFEYGVSPEVLIRIDGQDLTQEIKKHEVSELASKISKNKDVRVYLKDIQRNLASKRASILDGRDIGTVIFPNAVLKIFLTAKAEVRAKRRFLELEMNKTSESIDYDLVLKDLIIRDEQDQTREIAPLKQASDAVVIDASEKKVEEVVTEIIKLYQERI